MTTFDNFNASTQTRRTDNPTLLTDNNQVRKQPVNDIVKLTITPLSAAMVRTRKSL